MDMNNLTTKQTELVARCNDPEFPHTLRDNQYRRSVGYFNERNYPDRNKDRDVQHGIYFPSKYPDSSVSFTDLHGSGEHRTARSLEKLGIGRVFHIRPLDETFFKLI